MHHDAPLISILVAGFVLAFLFGAAAHRLRLPPLVGYLVAGILVGPHTPGFVANQQLAPQLAEIGVILLMFGVGLHFSVKDLWSVRALALPGAIVQIGAATILGWGLAAALGWPTGGGLIFGLALSVASTVVLLKALQDRRLVDTERGKVAIGWLIVEDIAMVLALVILPAAANLGTDHGGGSDPLARTIAESFDIQLGLPSLLAITLAKVVAFVALMLIVGRRFVPWILHWIAHTGSRELFRLGVLAIALGIGAGAAQLFGVSLALGAFFAGMVLSESPLSQSAAQESLPLRDAFAVLFFVSVGMLFDPTIVLREPLTVLATVAIILVGKSVAAYLIVRAFGRSRTMALTIAASLAQIGEFSFILAELGLKLQLLPEAGRDLILAGALISIILNPAVFWLAERWLAPRLDRKPAPAPAPQPANEPAPSPAEAPAATSAAINDDEDEQKPTSLADHVVVVGAGRVGGLIAESLRAQAAPFLVIEDADKRVAALKGAGVEVVVGNAASSEVLELANVAGAREFVIAIPNAFEAGQAIEQARKLNPNLHIVARAHSDVEVDHLNGLGADDVVMAERETARSMLSMLKERGAATDEAAGPPLIPPAPSIG